MKKTILCILSLMLVWVLTACGSGSTQEIKFQGINMEIPASWKAEKKTLSDDYAVYEKLNKNGHAYQLVLQDTFSLLENYDLNGAGEFFNELAQEFSYLCR